jgi:putative PIN family toxin of toxin-antitoxin system
MSRRVVFDTATVVSALLFAGGRLVWLRQHWSDGSCVPLISGTTAAELTRVLAYPKFRLSSDDRLELLSEYIPFCKSVEVKRRCPAICRDSNDQPFLDLAHSGRAEVLITGDRDLLELSGKTAFIVETPETYRHRVSG